MNLGDDAILIESRAARERQMAEMTNERAEDLLRRAKAIVFVARQGEGIATTEQMAAFYEVPSSTVRSVIREGNHRDELNSDGLKTLRGRDLKDARAIIALPSDTSQALTWTPRAALRLGMFLRDSLVARQVRTLLIDIAVQSVEARQPQRELELQVELQRLRNDFQRMGWEIVQRTSPRMLAFIRGELPLVRTEIQYVERQTGKPIGTTTNGRILPQLVEDIGLKRNSDEDKERVKKILKQRLGMNFETGEGLGKGFMTATPVVIPEDRYEECLQVVAVELYGVDALAEWQYSQQLLPDYLEERGLLTSGDETIDDLE